MNGKLNVYVFFYLIIILLFSGCGKGIYGIISRSQKDPEDFSMKVESFLAEREIKCSWEEDERCDKYILMRSEDRPELKFKEVYAGEGEGYTDKWLREGERYIYRLDKVRGKVKFKGNVHYMGIYGKEVEDEYEPNNEREQAVKLINDKQGNVYYYRSYEGVVLEDEDWYKIELPGKWKAVITIVYDASNQPFVITLPYNGKKERPATNGTVEIRNDFDEAKYMRFKVSLDKNIVTSGGASGAFYTYTVRIVSMGP
ncbi:hypothetical protein [Treponema pedis]|uniref:Lipoprotein n=1 Tax=Treponema pedis TaxID=409322 RepID=A0A7S6WQQ4_9SPIR|nr:hypothetical protein [Treponema pedis]QOW61618.1 hypothetical protein IFE08_04325 [Treponema pedis]QOW61906.1 hypothetical protein IFE08_06000 [Treponema pedis]